MLISQSTQQIHAQRTTMTPSLVRNVALLSYPVMQLQQEVLKVLEENPALEVIDEPNVESLDTIQDERYNSADSYKRFEFMESLLSDPETLGDHLIWQLHMEKLSDTEIVVGERIIESLDTHGFLTERPYVLCQDIEGYTDNMIEHVLHMIQELEPVGCAVQDVVESLTVQMDFIDMDDEHRTALLACITLLRGTKDNAEKLLSKYIQDETLQEYLHLLNPYPGLAYEKYKTVRPEYIIPDAEIALSDNDVIVQVNQDVIPVIAVDKKMLKAQMSNDATVSSLADQWITDANAFVNGLQYRMHSLEKVVAFIAHYHWKYFSQQQKFLDSLTRKHMAEQLHLHESTVSRIIVGKYLQTPQGLFEMKYFFSQRVGKQETSGHHLRTLIHTIIKEYEGEHIPDREIVILLEMRGIKVARRTVAKYRKQGA